MRDGNARFSRIRRIPVALREIYAERGERFIQAVFEQAAELDLPLPEAYDATASVHADENPSPRLSILT